MDAGFNPQRSRTGLLAAAAILLALMAAEHVLADGDREEKTFFSNPFTKRPTTLEDVPEMCDCTCGERNYGSRIVGGEMTDPNEFPWIVRLSYFNRFYCGGMLINDRYVLTAAHCVKGFMWFMIKVTMGEHDRCDPGRPKPETRFVLRAVAGDFSYLNFDNDVAILRLNDRVPITETIRPICLPKKTGDLYAGKRAIVSGWGTLKEDGKPACTLQEVEVPVMTNEECKLTKYNEKMISDNMMCAGYPDGGKDSCQGDSGGPLIREMDDKRYELIGVVSWGNGCARPGFPGIYTRVTRYLDWIKSNTRGGCWCRDTPPYKQTTPATTQKQQETTAKLEATTETHEAAAVEPEAVAVEPEAVAETPEATTEKHEETHVEAPAQHVEPATEQGSENEIPTTRKPEDEPPAEQDTLENSASQASDTQNINQEPEPLQSAVDETSASNTSTTEGTQEGAEHIPLQSAVGETSASNTSTTEGTQETAEHMVRRRIEVLRRHRKKTTRRPLPDTTKRPIPDSTTQNSMIKTAQKSLLESTTQ